ncbi:adenine-specific methyltransferase EcoRI family protein [Erysipelothrix rhusiopathiae]|nr:adenine-specific methyltransferase EcoRI family protein [Erysipelothrix rhusiopathiae]
MPKELLTSAKINKNDEFYTQLEDIEKEMKYYKEHFKNKVVYCNADDPFESNFIRYFALNFNFLGLKKLIATSYSTSMIVGEQLSLFDINTFEDTITNDKSPYKIEITEVQDFNEDGAIDWLDIEYILKNNKNTIKVLKGDGDFRSSESIELLKEADIVVTNPPFSLFREFVAQLIEYDKKFLIIGNQNAITYQQIFPLMKDNKMWLGESMNGSNRFFRVPEHYPLTESTGKIEEGKKYAFVKGVVWFTNLDNSKRNEELILYDKFDPRIYPLYDNYNAINVDRVTKIPRDYSGIMGVPITFFHKYNPSQFEILGMTKTPICFDNEKEAKRIKIYENVIQHSKNGKQSSGNKVNDGPTLVTEILPNGKTYYTVDSVEGFIVSPYARILIRNKKVED